MVNGKKKSMATSIQEKASKIKFIALDVDGTMTDGGIFVMPDGTQIKRFFSRDGEGIFRAKKAGIEVGIISAAGMAKDIIMQRAKIFGLSYVHAERSDKVVVAERWAKEMGISSDEVAYMGDDIPDAKVMEWSGLSACPPSSHKTVLEVADIVTENKAGYGAVREFIDAILDAQGKN